MGWISIYIDIKQLDLITHKCTNLNIVSFEQPLKL